MIALRQIYYDSDVVFISALIATWPACDYTVQKDTGQSAIGESGIKINQFNIE